MKSKADFKIVIVDDEKNQADFMEMLLESNNFSDITKCSSVTEALNHIKKNDCHFIATDYNMASNQDGLNGDSLVVGAKEFGYKGKITYLTKENYSDLEDFIALEDLDVSVILKRSYSNWSEQFEAIIHNSFSEALYESTGDYIVENKKTVSQLAV